MKCSRVARFNAVVGNPPAEDLEDVLNQIENQCTFLLEEVLETKEAAKRGDWTGCVDGVGDVKYVAAYLQTLLESVGVKFNKAYRKICDNNDQKFSISKELVLQWQAEKANSHPELETYIAETEYEGETYYTLRRKDNGKVVKHNSFEAVDLVDCIPNELVNKEE